MRKITALVWRRCGDADLRALLGRGGGHNVVAFGPPDIWRNFGGEIRLDANGGTTFAIEAEPGGAAPFNLNAYLHENRNEVRLKVPEILAANAQPAVRAQANAASLDPDGAKNDDLVVFVIKTDDARYHLRACLLSRLQSPVSDWVAANPTSGRTFEGNVLGPWELRIWNTLMRHKNVLLYGPPGTGKTWSMLQIQRAFERGIDEIAFLPSDLERPFHATGAAGGLPGNRVTEFVTFHQSLTYESFVIGLHPKPSAEGGGAGIEFAPKDGVFLRLAEHALQADAAALLVIDELNRGNVADILGELITVLEDDKRLAPNGQPRDTTVTVMLPFKPERLDQKFRMPSSIFLLASMNALDRSVAPLDSALRRRFRLMSANPNLDVARELMLGGRGDVKLQNPEAPSPDECKTIALELLRKLNSGIRAVLGPEFQMGQSYILPITDYQTLVEVLADVVFPQLYEVFRDRPSDLVELLGEDLVTLSEGLGDTGIGASGSVPAQLIDIRELNAGRLMRMLHALASGKPWSEPEPAPQA